MSEDVAPSAVRRALAFEVGIWHSLARWVLRRPDVPSDEGVTAFPYHRMVTPVFWLWIGASATEIVVVDLLLPWQTARIVAAILGLWGLAWMVGLLGALKVYPHLVDEDGIRVRNGFATDVRVSWSAIASATTQSHDLESSVRSVQLETHESGDVLSVGVSGRTNVLLRLQRPTTLTAAHHEHTVTGVRLWVDEPRDLVARLRTGVGTTPGRNDDQFG